MQVSIGGSDWAEIKDVSELLRSDRRAVNAAIVFEGDRDTGRPIIRASMDDDMTAAILQRVITNWSLPLPLPSADPAVLDKLTLEQDDALGRAVEPHIAAIRGREAPVKENPDPTPASAS